jgi:dihydroorotase
VPASLTSISSVTSIVIKGGLVIDRSGEHMADVVIESGHIVAVGKDLSGDLVLDASGCVVAPGLVDVHSHLREPGMEEAETIESGSRGAVLGGYTAVVAMPNTMPAIDCASVARDVLALGRESLCDVYTSAAITMGRAGEILTPMAELAALGINLFTDDGAGVQDPAIMRLAMEYAAGLDVTLAQHCEIESLSHAGHMNEGAVSAKLGVAGIPAEAEELMVSRDIALAKLTGAKVHFQHMSTAGSVELIRAARATGMSVSAEATTHHFTLTDSCLESYDPIFKVNPPLRTAADIVAVKAGLADGTIDAIATDHAPHTPETKERPLDQAPPGMLGLETALALALTELDLPIADVLRLMSWRPAEIVGIDDVHSGKIEVGAIANVCVFDPQEEWTISGSAMASKSRNTPYEGRTVRGKVRHTIVAGEAVVIDAEAQR